jgi:hypothetical protein
MTRLRLLVSIAALMLCLGLTASPRAVAVAEDTLPARLTDDEFWKYVEEFSEPNGYFQSDNLLSNEIWFQYVIPDLVARTKPGGVYLGVGPEQNYTYIAALKPKMVFITDIRRGNLWMHLMYKALFELSTDRAEFMSRLFTKPRPPGLGPKSTAAEIQNAFWDVTTGPKAVYDENVRAIDDVLVKKHKLPLVPQDVQGIHDSAYYNFYWFGPRINYNSSSGRGDSGNYITYGDLMMSTDASGVYRSYLASEENFRVLKDLHERNLIIPIVGDFAGPKALRAVGRYLKEKGATVTAFYLSNVEQYLQRNGVWQYFCGNVASLPLDEQSTFIRSVQGGGGGGGGGLVNQLGSMRTETRGCAESQAAPAGVRRMP